MYLVNIRILFDFIDLLPAVLHTSHAVTFVTIRKLRHSAVVHIFIVFCRQKARVCAHDFYQCIVNNNCSIGHDSCVCVL